MSEQEREPLGNPVYAANVHQAWRLQQQAWEAGQHAERERERVIPPVPYREQA